MKDFWCLKSIGLLISVYIFKKKCMTNGTSQFLPQQRKTLTKKLVNSRERNA